MKKNKPKTDENTNDVDSFAPFWITRSEFEKMGKDEVEVMKIITQIIRSFLTLSGKKRKVFEDAFEKAFAETTRKTASGKTNLKTEVKTDA